ncbi:MAG: YIP1 family protein [Candidatus Aminicenantes bacterium]|nr:YIP1 family protein [Candidatus Aminicenantes bacterium]
MDLVARVQNIVLRPKEEWLKIKEEPTDIKTLFTSYAAILAVIPAVANFIGMSLIGRRIPFLGWYRLSIPRGIVYAIFAYLLSLAAVVIVGFVIKALAPTFSSTPNLIQAMKLAVYSYTPGWVVGILYIIPALSPLVILASLYGLYLLYVGLATPLMETPKEKVFGYFLVSLVVSIVVVAVFSIILGGIFAVREMASGL